MTVVNFPNEYHRIILNKLDQKPKFKIYLGALEKCIQRDLDVTPLIHWWDINHSRIAYDDVEDDFLATLDRIQLGHLSWEEEKKSRIEKHELYLQDDYQKQSNNKDFAKSFNDYLDGLENNIKSQHKWAFDNPLYKSTLWIREWLPLFKAIYGDIGPLEIIAKRFDIFFDKSLITDWDETGKNIDVMSLEEFKYRLLDKPVYVVYGSEEHHHLKCISSWISKNRNNKADIVFNYLLSSLEEKEKIGQLRFIDAAKTCSHRLFSYLMINDNFEMDDWEVLASILKLPLAVTADPNGKPHLTPEFGFIGHFFQGWWGIGYVTPDDRAGELANIWKIFFHSYTHLRREQNNGKNFPHADLIYKAAIASVWNDENCYEFVSNYKSSCIMKSLNVIQSDIFCALEFFNESYYPTLYETLITDWSPNEESDQLSLEKIIAFTNIQLSLIDHFVEKEGWYDFACSMFAFYLVVAICFSKGNLDAIEDLPKIIKSLSGLPRFEYVSRAIDFACSVALENGRSTTFARLDQFRQSIDEEIKSLIAGGETQLCEFKSTLRRNLHTGQDDHKIEHSVLKTIAGFLNKEGGRLLIGVSDIREITGIEADGFESFDKWQLHFKNLVSQTLANAMDFIECKVHTMGDKTVSVINCNRSLKPVYYRNRVTKQEEFYVRRGNATDNLAMSDAFEYIKYHFQS